jgi:lipoate-protein ligase A
MNWRLIPFGTGAPAWNMAVDEAIFCSYLAGHTPPTLRFYNWSPPTLSVGHFQEITSEVDLPALAERGFGLVRRNTGGRAVLHHHELTYSVVAGVTDGLPPSLFNSYLYISKALVNACRIFGVAAELHEGATDRMKGTGACFEAPSWYELTVNGRKLAGSAQLRQHGSFLQHGSILIDFSAEDLGKVLKLTNISFDTWITKMKQRVTSFQNLGVSVTAQGLAGAIVESFQSLYDIRMIEGLLTEEELATVEKLIVRKYGNDNWNLVRGRSAQTIASH